MSERAAHGVPWRELPFSAAPMGRQLALSEALLSGVSVSQRPALRWYVPREPALVLGNGQQASVVNRDAAHASGARVWRRTSGGTAVYADTTLLSLDIALPADHPLASSDVVRAYQWLGEAWAESLHALGIVKARALPTEEVRAIPPLGKGDPLRLACYGTLSPWEVVVGQRKVVGLCQVRRRSGTLYQAGVYLHFDPKALGALLDLGNNQRKVLGTRLHNAAVGLDTVAGRTIAAEEVSAAVRHAITHRYGVRLAPAHWLAEELAAADRLAQGRFQPLD